MRGGRTSCMRDESPLEFENLEKGVRGVEEHQQRDRELRLVLLGVVAGVVATVPAELLLKPLVITATGALRYGTRTLAFLHNGAAYALGNLAVAALALAGVWYGYRRFTGYYDDPTVRVPLDYDANLVFERLHDYLEEEARAHDLHVDAAHDVIACTTGDGDLVLEVKFDTGRDVAYFTYNPRITVSGDLLDSLHDRFGADD